MRCIFIIVIVAVLQLSAMSTQAQKAHADSIIRQVLITSPFIMGDNVTIQMLESVMNKPTVFRVIMQHYSIVGIKFYYPINDSTDMILILKLKRALAMPTIKRNCISIEEFKKEVVSRISIQTGTTIPSEILNEYREFNKVLFCN